MAKKIFALVMVMSIMGGILAGCSGGDAAGTDGGGAGAGTEKTDGAAETK